MSIRFIAYPFVVLYSLLIISCSEESPREQAPIVNIEEIAGRLEHGIDVSCHVGDVVWDSVVAQGYSFAFAKATEGDDLKDSLFDHHWQQMKRVGITRGAYHFYVTEDDPEKQASFFIESVKLEPGDLAPVVDIELIGHNTQPGLADRLHRWLEIVEQHYGVKPIIYTSTNFWNAHLSAGFGDYPLWLAEYEVDQPRIPDGWTDWHVWQWKENSPLPGVEKGADLSRVNLNLKHLADLLLADTSPRHDI